MRIIFEDHLYQASLVADDLKDICILQDAEKRISVGYVGYFYNTMVKDCVFILPKVLLKDSEMKDENGRHVEVVAGVYDREEKETIRPEDIINPHGQEKYLSKEYRKFLFEFAVWIYRALDVYRKHNPSSSAIYYRQLPQSIHGMRRKANTFLLNIFLIFFKEIII